MNNIHIIGYHYCGPPLKNSGEFVPERDSHTLGEKIKEASSSRALDAAGNLDIFNTCVLIFERAHDLPRIEGKQYVINLSDQRNPKLEIVEEDASLQSHYRTSKQIYDERISLQNKKSQKPRRKGWTNNFIYGKQGQ
ncbi:MAG: hypothetical protein AABY00_01570 [Nanoarchaeota archaeon]